MSFISEHQLLEKKGFDHNYNLSLTRKIHLKTEKHTYIFDKTIGRIIIIRIASKKV